MTKNDIATAVHSAFNEILKEPGIFNGITTALIDMIHTMNQLAVQNDRKRIADDLFNLEAILKLPALQMHNIAVIINDLATPTSPGQKTFDETLKDQTLCEKCPIVGRKAAPELQ